MYKRVGIREIPGSIEIGIATLKFSSVLGVVGRQVHTTKVSFLILAWLVHFHWM
jgi:hypothetical protein